MPEASIQLTSNAAEIIGRFARLPSAVQNGIARGIRRQLLVTESKVRQRAGVKFRRGGAGLAGRLTSYARTEPNGAGLDAAIGFRKTKDFPYELSQEFGAKAKPGKAMAIPVTPQAVAAGSPRNFPGKLTLIKGHGKAVLIADLGLSAFRKGGADLVQYVLVKSIPARLKFFQTVMEDSGQISNAIAAGADEGWRAV